MFNKNINRLVNLLCIVSALILVAQATFAQNAKPSPSDCDAYARNYAERYSGSMLGGAAKGALGGGIFGAIIGDSSKTTKRGAAFGAVAGGVKRGVNSNELRRRAYDDCMAGRVQW
jgi:uncharacterized protein YcfJ